jgi:hypothetical protein
VIVLAIALLGLVQLVTLGIALRVVTALQEGAERRATFADTNPELSVGTAAPGFRAYTLDHELRTLESFAGSSLLLIFSSPLCERCRREMPEILRIVRSARDRAGIPAALVSDGKSAVTADWVRQLTAAGSHIDIPVLVPALGSKMLSDYNPRGIFPYFCLLDESGGVQDRGLVGQRSWKELRRSWSANSSAVPWIAAR